MMEQEILLEKIKTLIEPILKSRQIELVELKLRYEGSRLVLKLLVDTAPGITLEGLSSLNQVVSAILDEHDLIGHRYFLEVSSPGLDRPLKTVSDFERVIGRRLRVQTQVSIGGGNLHVGTLTNANEEAIVLKLDSGEKRRILLSEILQAVQEVKL